MYVKIHGTWYLVPGIWNANGTNMERGWYKVCMKIHKLGSEMVRILYPWYGNGTNMVRTWYGNRWRTKTGKASINIHLMGGRAQGIRKGIPENHTNTKCRKGMGPGDRGQGTFWPILTHFDPFWHFFTYVDSFWHFYMSKIPGTCFFQEKSACGMLP